MSSKFQAVRGMNDILPDDINYWHYLESNLANIANSYGYKEIRFPILEQTALFKRTIGDVTDIVEKEMYTFDDRNGDSLTLRPEGTAACVRACLQHGLLHNQMQRLWYMGPMFRHERPQKGRYRQFYQFGVEAFGFDSVEIELELLLMTSRLWDKIGLKNELTLQLNSLGSPDERLSHRKKLISYFEEHISELDEDSLKRLHKNPLRILDSKNPSMKRLLEAAPKLSDEFGEKSTKHFEQLCEGLSFHGVAYTINSQLVRGLDYYSSTVFEWVTESLGAQGTVCAGGRYDGLVEQFGSRKTPAVGFAFGMERIILMLTNLKKSLPTDKSVYVIAEGGGAFLPSFKLAEKLRDSLPNITVLQSGQRVSLKSQFKKADKSGALYAVILMDNDVANQKYTVKSLRDPEAEQQMLSEPSIVEFLNARLV